MIQLSFETLSFGLKENNLEVTLLKIFKTEIPINDLEKIGFNDVIDTHTLGFKDKGKKRNDEEKISIKFSFLLTKYFDNLTNKLTKNKTTYIHRNSGIPLIGNPAFGIVYRNSSIIEIKPITSCNLNCIYCSISEGLDSKKNDFVVEKDYLVEELKKLIDFVDEKVEVHIGVQGEPFLYADIDELISDIQKMEKVHTISIDTNGTFLNKDRIDELNKNDKLQLNFSLDAFDETLAKKITGVKNYNANHVKEMIAYASEKMKVIVAPVLVQGYNDEEMEKIIKWVKSLKNQPHLGIQNFLPYKTGRNPAKVIPWPKFFNKLEEWDKKYDLKLRWTKEDFGVHKTKELSKPFRMGDVINAVIKCPDRFPDSVVAVSSDRNISVPNCKFVKEKKIKVKIVRDKHNVFSGKIDLRTGR